MFVVMVMMMTAAAFMVMVVVAAAAAFMVVVMTAAAFVAMVVVVTAAAFMVVVVVMTAATFMVMVVMMAAAAFVVMVMVVAAATFMFMVRFMRRLVTMPVAGHNDHLMLHRPGDLCQLSDQRIRILRCQPQLLGGKGDGSLFHLRQGIEFCFYFRRAVGAVQIFHNVYLPFHMYPPY